MDEVEIEIKDEFIHQDEELQAKKKSIVSSSKENTNILNKEVHIKNEPIDQGFILPSTDQENTLVKSETIEMKTDLKTNVKKEDFGKFEACEQVGIDLITNKDFNYPSAKSEFFNMKTEIKIEIKEESFERIEAREQGGIEFITSKDFDHSFNESEFPNQKTDVAIKRKIIEEPNESNVPLKKFKQKESVHQSMPIKEEFDTSIQSELNEKSISNDQNQSENTNFMNSSICPKIEEGTTENCDKPEAFSEFEESVIFVKSETDLKPEISFGNDPLDITATEDNFLKKDTIDKSCHQKPKVTYAKLIDKALSNATEGMTVPPDIYKAITAHKRNQSVHAIIQCQFCSAKFMTNKGMDQHIKVHEGISRIKCCFCHEKFANAADMKAHLLSVHMIKCQFCPAKFKANKELSAHLSSVHGMHIVKKRVDLRYLER